MLLYTPYDLQRRVDYHHIADPYRYAAGSTGGIANLALPILQLNFYNFFVLS